MDRSRITGIGRRVEREKTSSSSSAGYTPTRNTRVLVEDSAFKYFSGGLRDLGNALASNTKQLTQEEKQRQHEQEQTLKIKAVVAARENKKRALAAYESFLNDNPQYQYLTPEEVIQQSDEASHIETSHFSNESIPVAHLREQALAEFHTSLYEGYEKRRSEKEKQENLAGVKSLIRNDALSIASDDPKTLLETAPKIMRVASKYFGVSQDEFIDLVIEVAEQDINDNPSSEGELVTVLAGLETLTADQRDKLNTYISNNAALSKQRRNVLKAGLSAGIEKAIAGGVDIMELYRNDEPFEGVKLSKYFTPNEASSIAETANRKIAKQEDLKGAALAYAEGRVFSFNSANGYFNSTSTEDLLSLENHLTETVYKKDPRYLQASEQDKPAVLAQLQIEGAKENNTVPIIQKQIVTKALTFPDEPFATEDQVPNGLKEALTVATKLEMNGMLGTAIGHSREASAFRTMLYLTQHGESTLGAINRVIIAQRDNPGAFTIDYRTQDKIAETLRNDLSSMFRSKDEYKALPQATRAAARIYSNFRAFGLTSDEARQATMKQIEDDFIPASGALLSRRALEGIDEVRVKAVTKKLIEDFVEINDHLNEEDVYITEINFGNYMFTDEHGTPYISKPTTGQPNARYLGLNANHFKEVATKIEGKMTSDMNQATRDAQAHNIKVESQKRSPEYTEAQSKSLMFPTF